MAAERVGKALAGEGATLPGVVGVSPAKMLVGGS